MKPIFVTGYIPLHNNYRKNEEYIYLGNQLLNCGLPFISFIDDSVNIKLNKDEIRYSTNLDSCWLTPISINKKLPPTDNPSKDTIQYHSIQFQKTKWILEASKLYNSNLYIWIDFGILHVPGVTIDIIKEYYKNICLLDYFEKIDKITMASIWRLTKNSFIDFLKPNWYLAGGTFIIPKYLTNWFSGEIERQTISYINKTNLLTWEINIWAQTVLDNPELFQCWYCDHNTSMFSNFILENIQTYT
jgi:hypothetical protein